MNLARILKWMSSTAFALVICTGGTQANAQFTASSLQELRNFSSSFNNGTVQLSPTSGDPHPVTGVVTPGEYWLDGDHIASPASTHPRFLLLGGTGNTYNFAGTTIYVDTRKLEGYGRGLGHDSGVDVVRLEGSNNLVQDITLIGRDIALDTDPNAQRYADWSTVYFELSGDDNTVDGANIIARGSRTDTYGLSDAFGKGAAQQMQPFIAHRKASNFRVGEATNAVVNDIHLETYSFGHNFFVQQSTNTTLTNSTILAELFPSRFVVARPEYLEYGYTWWGHPMPNNILLAGSEGGVRVYNGASGLTVDNVTVDGARTGFATVHTGGDVVLNNCYAFNTTSGFDVGDNTTITNSGGNIVNGPLLVFYGSGNNTDIDLELTEGTPIGINWSAAYFNGNADISIWSDLAAEDLPEESYVRLGQSYFNNWRDQDYNIASPEAGGPTSFNGQTFVNDTNQIVVIGENAEDNVGRSQGGVISNGKENYYDGITYILSGSWLEVVHVQGLGNSGEAVFTGNVTADTLDDNSTIVRDGGTLELAAGIRIVDEKLTISGEGFEGVGALYAAGSGARFGSSSNGDVSTIFLDGDASIGVDVDLIVGRTQGVGDLTKLGDGRLSLEKSNTFLGDLIVAAGEVSVRSGGVNHGLTVNAGASIAAIGDNGYNTDGHAEIDGTMDLNGRTGGNMLSQRIGSLGGNGRVTSSNEVGGFLEILGADSEGVFSGEIDGLVNVLKTGVSFQTLSGDLNHTGTTEVDEGGLLIDGMHIGGGAYTVVGGLLGGSGTINSDVTVSDGGSIAPGGVLENVVGTLTVGGNFSQDSQSLLVLDLDSVSSSDQLAVLGVATLSGVLDLSSTDLSDFGIGDTMTLVSAVEGLNGKFDSVDGVLFGDVDGLVAALAVEYGSQGVTARVSILGDTNFDDQVDVLTDAFQLIANLGTSSGATFADGDFNGDGQVDVLGDAFLLIANLGAMF